MSYFVISVSHPRDVPSQISKIAYGFPRNVQCICVDASVVSSDQRLGIVCIPKCNDTVRYSIGVTRRNSESELIGVSAIYDVP